MFKNFYLSAALALGLTGCSSKLEDTVLHADINKDGKEDIIRLRRSEGLSCDYNVEEKSPPGIYVLLGLGNSFGDGHPFYNACEITVRDLSDLVQIDPQLGRIAVADYTNDGRLDIIYTPVIKTRATIVFSDKYGDSMTWEPFIERPY